MVNEIFFDTIKVKPKASVDEIRKRAVAKKINLRYFEDKQHVIMKLFVVVVVLNLLWAALDLFFVFFSSILDWHISRWNRHS